MFQLQKLPYLLATFLILCLSMLCFCGKKAKAMKVEYYSYDTLKAALPSNLRSSEYLYNLSNGDTCVAFATYNGRNYVTSVKKQVGQNDYLYCIDYSNHIIFNKNYDQDNDFFDNDLMTRIAIALEYGTTQWDKQASDEFTTGNSILDYYMTQIVIHSLIYDFGGSQSDCGIDYDLIEYKTNTGSLSDRTYALYCFCYYADITISDNYLKASEFSFQKPAQKQLLLNNKEFVTPFVQCKINSNNAAVSNYERAVTCYSQNKRISLDNKAISVKESARTYNSDVKLSVQKANIDQFAPGFYTIHLAENVTFSLDQAVAWSCSDASFSGVNQSVCGVLPMAANASDSLDFELLVGDVVLYKKDCYNNNTIPDAEFELLQFNDSTKNYEHYSNLTYNAKNKRYESGNIYLSTNNPSGKFKVIETKAGEGYMKDWKGKEFQITKTQYSYSINAVNQPLKKCDIQVFKYYNAKDKPEEKLPLSGVKFALYAGEDLLDGNGQIIYKKDSLVGEKVSDEQGGIVYSDLPYGDYYLKELDAPKDFIISDEVIPISKSDFSLKSDSQFEYFLKKEIVNHKCLAELKIQKFGEAISGFSKEKSDNGEFYTYQYEMKPLENVTFSLYDSEKKFIESQVTDASGTVSFKEIEPGEYYYKEENCPPEYQIDNEYKPIIFEADNKTYHKEAPPIIEEHAENELCSFKLSLHKYGEQAKVVKHSLTYSEIPMKNVLFGIYQNFDSEAASGEKLKDNSCVGYLLTDENGKAEYEGKLPIGKYYIKELKTNSGFIIDDKTYDFEISPNNNAEINVNLDNTYHLLNRLSKASVQIHKTDINTDEPLKGVEFTLYNANDEEIGRYKTDINGEILVKDLPYGSYYFIETKCKNGYYSSNNKYSFKLESDERIILEITNSPIIKLGFAEHYKLGLAAIFVIICSVFVFGIFHFKKTQG